jgi:hypothetical protein
VKGKQKLLIFHCFGVYHRRKFYGDYPQFRPVLKNQLETSLSLLANGDYDVLIFSGGYTKPQVEKSEARGMLDWAEVLHLTQGKDRILLEEFARDSLENLLYSMCRFFQFFDEFPALVHSCTWKFNVRRYEIFAQKLALPNFQVVPVGRRNDEERIAEELARLAESDPFSQKQPGSAEKYLKRDPWKKIPPYAQINERFQKLFIKLAELRENGGDPAEAKDLFPWT